MSMRIGLLFGAAWIISLTGDLFTVFGMSVLGRDLTLIFGELLLVVRAVTEIHEKVEGNEECTTPEEKHGIVGLWLASKPCTL
jgi:predicted tellurium resistance membrane protein TerC